MTAQKRGAADRLLQFPGLAGREYAGAVLRGKDGLFPARLAEEPTDQAKEDGEIPQGALIEPESCGDAQVAVEDDFVL